MQEIGVVEISPFYRLQRLLLNISIPSPSFVSINGNWPIQKRHLINIENPCLTKGELDSGFEVTEKKIITVISKFVLLDVWIRKKA